ncbi:MAG: DUF2339 domain-containing protein, partial [Actinomycetota bacterium]
FVFALIPFVGSLVKSRASEARDVALNTSNAFLFFGAAMALLSGTHEGWQGPFAFGLAAVHLGFAGLLRWFRRADPMLNLATIGLSIAFFTLAIPIHLEQSYVGITWCVEGALLAWLARGHRGFRLTGLVAITLSFLAAAIELGTSYEPERLLVSADSSLMALQIAFTYVGAKLLSHTDRRDDELALAPAVAIAANLLTLGWLGYEAVEQLERMGADSETAVQFTLSALLAIYSAALLLAGVAARLPWVRWFAVALFSVVVVKLVLLDLWLLDGLHRTISFIGLGALMLLCSLAFNRFKEMLTGEPLRGPAAGV